MIEQIWSGKSGWWRLLLPLSWLYGGITWLLRQTYRCGMKKSWKAPLPVVVVGNLTAGGNGKTPVVIWLVEQLTQRGFKPAVVSRGYGGKSDFYPVILSQQTTTLQAGDEPVLIYQRTGVPVAIAPKRSAAIKELIACNAEIDLIITDDGLQHYALQRDFEIVVIDGLRRFGNGWWIPAGPMRERATRLATVDAIITNGGSAQSNEISMTLEATQLINLLTGEKRSLEKLSGQDLVAMAGIGHPPRFFNTLRGYGLVPIAEHAFADHHAFTPAELSGLTSQQQWLVMTEKDAVKCRPFAQANWWYLPVDAQLSQPQAEQLLAAITALVKAAPDKSHL